MAKSKKSKDKAKLNLTVRGEQRNKLEQMASLEKRSVSNLVEQNAAFDGPCRWLLKAKTVGACKLTDMKSWVSRRPVYSVLSTAK